MRWYDMGHHTQSIALWVIIFVLAALVIAAAGRGRKTASAPGAAESPEQILKRRYAAGELDRETYLRMLADVRRDPGSAERKEVA